MSRLPLSLALCLLLPAVTGYAAAPQLAGCGLFPDDAVFNVRIDDAVRFPRHPLSDVWISRMGTRALHLDFGRNEDPAAWNNPDNGYWGIPWNAVDGTAATTDWPVVSFTVTDPRAGNGDGVPEESDCAVSQPDGFGLVRGCDTLAPGARRFPFPHAGALKAEQGNCNDAQVCGDRHILVVEQGSCRLWESYFSYQVDGQWYAWSTAAWNLASPSLRPAAWTSGDAAGLPILPLLMRVDEAESGVIQHAFRVTLQDSLMDNTFVWPARHRAGGATAQGVPFGAVLRLRSDFVIPSAWSPQARALARALQQYGLYVADIGSNLYVQGEPSARWDPALWDQLQSLQATDFEFVDLGAITRDAAFDPDSLQVPPALVTADDAPPVTGGGGAGGGGGGGGTVAEPPAGGGGGCTLAGAPRPVDPLWLLPAAIVLWRRARRSVLVRRRVRVSYFSSARSLSDSQRH